MSEVDDEGPVDHKSFANPIIFQNENPNGNGNKDKGSVSMMDPGSNPYPLDKKDGQLGIGRVEGQEKVIPQTHNFENENLPDKYQSMMNDPRDNNFGNIDNKNRSMMPNI